MSDTLNGHILIIDDNLISRKKLKMAVETLGYTADAAASGEAGLAAIAARSFDAILLDMLMPGLDGLQVLERIKSGPKNDLPVIVVSELEGDIESVSRAIELGAEDFLPKSFDPVILKARLQASLRKKHFRDQELEYFNRINALTDAAEKVEAGHFDETSLELREEAKINDPIGRLALVFQGMANEIHAREVRLLQRIRTLQGSLLLLACGACSGLTPALSRLSVGMGSNPIGMAAWVDFFAAVICLSIVFLRGTFPTLTLRHMAFFAVWAFLVGILQHVSIFILARHVEATYLTLVLALESLLVFAFAATMKLEAAAPRRILGLVVGFAGIGLSLFNRLEGNAADANFWLFAALLAPLLFALETLTVAAKRPENIDPIAAVGLMFAFSILFAVPLAGLSGNLIPAAEMMTSLGVVIFLLAAVSIVANLAFVYLLDLAGAVFASQTAYATALAGIVWGMLLLGETMSWLAWVAILFVLGGMYLVETKPSEDPIRIKRDFRAEG